MNIYGSNFTGVNIVSAPTSAPSGNVSLGSTFEWTSGTYFDSWTSQTATDSDLAITGGPGLFGGGYNTNQLVWQLFYAHQAIQLTVASNKWGFVPYQGGSNSIGLRGSSSTVNDTLGSFAVDSVVSTTGSVNYTADVLNERAVNTLFSVSASRYFLLGMVGGPFYRMFKSLATNRTALINGNPVVTVFNKFYWGRWNDGPTTGIPTQLGGSATFTEVTGYVPVLSFKFTT